MEDLAAVHPGRVLREEFLAPVRLTSQVLAERIRMSDEEVSQVVSERCGMTAELAIRLARFFGTSSDFWMELQASHELARARTELKEVLPKIEPYATAAS